MVRDQRSLTAALQVTWGIDMSSEHERYLSEKVFGGPVIVYNYPKAIKVSSLAAHRSGVQSTSCHLTHWQHPTFEASRPHTPSCSVFPGPGLGCLCALSPSPTASHLLHGLSSLLECSLDSWCLLAGVLHA